MNRLNKDGRYTRISLSEYLGRPEYASDPSLYVPQRAKRLTPTPGTLQEDDNRGDRMFAIILAALGVILVGVVIGKWVG